MTESTLPAPNAYSLPPVLGYPHHAVNKYRYPQYSISPALPSISKPFGPGPKYELDAVTRVGKASPFAYSIKSRPQPLTKFVCPGPGTYKPEECPRMKDQRPPCYSIKSRKAVGSKMVTPGPKYAIPSTLGCKVPDLYNRPCYTMRPKHDVKQAWQTPGPKYVGIDTNIIKPRPPLYSMRPKIDTAAKENSPGPKYYPTLPRCIQSTEEGYSFGLKITKTNPYYTEDDLKAAC